MCLAHQYQINRTLAHTALDIYNRWYGGTGRKDEKLKPGLAPVLAQKMVAACRREMDAWIAEYGESVAISGTVAALELGPGYSEEELAQDVDVEGDDED